MPTYTSSKIFYAKEFLIKIYLINRIHLELGFLNIKILIESKFLIYV